MHGQRQISRLALETREEVIDRASVRSKPIGDVWCLGSLILALYDVKFLKLSEATRQNFGGYAARQAALQLGKSQRPLPAEEPHDVHQPFQREKA